MNEERKRHGVSAESKVLLIAAGEELKAGLISFTEYTTRCVTVITTDRQQCRRSCCKDRRVA